MLGRAGSPTRVPLLKRRLAALRHPTQPASLLHPPPGPPGCTTYLCGNTLAFLPGASRPHPTCPARWPGASGQGTRPPDSPGCADSAPSYFGPQKDSAPSVLHVCRKRRRVGVSVASQIPLLAGVIENIVKIVAFVILAKPPAVGPGDDPGLAPLLLLSLGTGCNSERQPSRVSAGTRAAGTRPSSRGRCFNERSCSGR